MAPKKSLENSHSQASKIDDQKYVSRAGHKLASVAKTFKLIFKDKNVLDVGSSTGGFTDFALQHGAKNVFAVELGTDQLHPSLRGDSRIELHEKTDIRDIQKMPHNPDLILVDVSFISVREILPHLSGLMPKNSAIIVMVKPQFETTNGDQKNKGVIKNERIRRQILKDFEDWAKPYFVITQKADSDLPGVKGNRERFYVLMKIR